MLRVYWFILGLVCRPAFRRRVSALVLKRGIRELYLGRESIRLSRAYGVDGCILGLNSGLCELLGYQVFCLFPDAWEICKLSDFVVGFENLSLIRRCGGVWDAHVAWWPYSFDGAVSRLHYLSELCALSGFDYDTEASEWRRVKQAQ